MRVAVRLVIRTFGALILLVGLISAVDASPASAQGTCAAPQGSKFDGYGAVGSYNGHTYRGVTGSIITRLGYSCDGDNNPNGNFSTAWFMMAGPSNYHCGLLTRGYAQAGYFRGNGQGIYSYAETNADGCGPLRRILWSSESAGQVHAYQVSWFSWANVMAMQLDSQIGSATQAMLYSDFDPVVAWGQQWNTYGNGWEPNVLGEVKYYESDMPGAYGSSALFYAIGSNADTIGWFGGLGLNTPYNDNSSRWARSGLNAYNPAIYGLNFEIYTY